MTSGALTEAEAEAAFLEELNRLSGQVENGVDQAAVTCIRLCTLYPQLPPVNPSVSAPLRKALSVLLGLICHSSYPGLRHNACAALTGALVYDPSLVDQALSSDVTKTALEQLQAATDAGLKRNLIVLLGTIADSSYEGLHDFVASGAMQAILKAGTADTTGELAQDVSDTICKVCMDPDSRVDLLDMGTVRYLGQSMQSADPEAQVRSLMCLAMLLEGHDDAQADLLSVKGVVPTLFSILREADADSDSKHFAQSMINEFSKKESLKTAMLEQLRASTAVKAGA